MEELFRPTVLTAAVNKIKPSPMKVYDRLFRGKEHLEPTDKLAFEVISGSQGILKSISIYAPATVTDKTGRKVITMQAPRLAQKRFIHTAELNELRAYGEKIGFEMMQARIAREQKDMRAMIDRTLEFWAVNALKGKILDADLTTVLVDYNLPASHKPVLTGTDLWTDSSSDPVSKIREFKKLIEDDSYADIREWVAFVGSDVMDALLNHPKVRELLRYSRGAQIAENGRIEMLAEVKLIEYNGFFRDENGNLHRFIDPDEFLLVGVCDDLTDVPFAPIVDDDAPGGVGNVDENGNGVLYFSKSWKEEDPSGRWIKVEARPLPVLQRPGAVVDAKVV